MVNWYAPKLMPLAKVMRKIGGRAGARLVPILDQSDKLVPPTVQRGLDHSRYLRRPQSRL